MPKSYKPQIVLNRRKPSSKSDRFFELFTFSNFGDFEFLENIRFFSKKFLLQTASTRFSRRMLCRAERHSTILESTILQLQNATTFMKKYSFALEISMPKSYKLKIVLNRRKSSSKSDRFFELFTFSNFGEISDFFNKKYFKLLQLDSREEYFVERKGTAPF